MRTLKTVIWLIAVILLVELGFLIFLVRPDGFILWATIAIIAVMGLYLVRISLNLISRLDKATKNNK